MSPDRYDRTEAAFYDVAQTHISEFGGDVDLYPGYGGDDG